MFIATLISGDSWTFASSQSEILTAFALKCTQLSSALATTCAGISTYSRL